MNIDYSKYQLVAGTDGKRLFFALPKEDYKKVNSRRKRIKSK